MRCRNYIGLHNLLLDEMACISMLNDEHSSPLVVFCSAHNVTFPGSGCVATSSAVSQERGVGISRRGVKLS